MLSLMKRNKLFIYSAIGISSALIYKFYKQRRATQRKQLALDKIEAGLTKEAIPLLEEVWEDERSEDVRKILVETLYSLNDFEKVILYAKGDLMTLFECNFLLKRHKEALFNIFSYFYKTQDVEAKQKINMTLNICIKNAIKKHKINKLSPIVYKEFFETFPFLFKDFKYAETNKTTSTEIKIIEVDWITNRHFETVKGYVERNEYEALREYIEDRKDNLSIFLDLSFALIERRGIDSSIKLYEDWSQGQNKDYEEKVYVYCKVLLDFSINVEGDYNYEDISTCFYKMKSNKADTNKYIENIINYGPFSFTFYFLVGNNHYLAERAFNLFPTDPKILSIAFEVFIFTRNYEMAEKVLGNMNKYCKDDPRTYLCLYFEQKLKHDNDKIETLLEGYQIDPLYYKTSVLLGQLYLESDDEKAAFFLRNAVECCNNEEDLCKIYETLILHETKVRVIKE